MVENRQLRRERDLLMQKLARSKGALRETLDRLGGSGAPSDGPGGGGTSSGGGGGGSGGAR